jgi:pimeloyl-ACP methyl ester carboxylesterase
MPMTIPTQRADFMSGGSRCAAWLTLPTGPGPHPGVVLAHGLGATHDMMLAQYEQHFAAAGIATLAFDYRYTGASDGQPRQRISISEQCRDIVAAVDHLKSDPEIDSRRIGLWGTSLGGMNVVRVAATRDDIAGAIVQCPIVHGPAAARSLGMWAALRLAPAIAEDLLRLPPNAAAGTYRSSAHPEASRWSPCQAPNRAGIPRFRPVGCSTTGSWPRTLSRWSRRRRCGTLVTSMRRCSSAYAIAKTS